MSDHAVVDCLVADSEDFDVPCERCGTDDWRVTMWPGWAECSWCGHRQEVGP